MDRRHGECHILLVEFEGPERHEQMAQVERLVRREGYDPDDLFNPDVMFSERALTDDLRPIL